MEAFMEISDFDKDKIFRFLTGVVFAGFVIAILWSYGAAKKGDSKDKIVPVVSADKSAVKIKPEDEGGMDIPFRETEIYDSVTSSSDDTATSKVKEVKAPAKEVKFKEPAKKKTVKKKKAKKEMDDLITSISKEKKSSGGLGAGAFNTHRAQLGSVKSEREAVSVWRRLSRKHSSVLKGLTSHVEEAKTSKGTFFRVQTSAMTKKQAEAICGKIKNCLVVTK